MLPGRAKPNHVSRDLDTPQGKDGGSERYFLIIAEQVIDRDHVCFS